MPNLDALDLSTLGPVIIFVLLWGAMEKWHSYRIESLRSQEREAERQLLRDVLKLKG
ncbi:MAG: hypothetical protein V3R83_09665 [Gammaproteobacteria bacterium]